MKTYSFEKLSVWKESRKLNARIYLMTKDYPAEERYGLTSQMRRSSLSVASIIAEETSRFSAIEQIRFYEIAYGSLMELLNQLILSFDLKLLLEQSLYEVRLEIDSIAFKLSKLRESVEKN